MKIISNSLKTECKSKGIGQGSAFTFINLLRLCIVSLLVPFDLAFAQGHLNFANRVFGDLDARVTFLDGTPVGAGYTAQMYGGPAGTPVQSLVPLLPTTIFRSGAGVGYVVQVSMVVPGVDQCGTFVMRVFDGATWETSLCRGESNPVTVELTYPPGPPATLVGLQPFQVNCIPEPSTIVLGIAGAITALLWRQRRG